MNSITIKDWFHLPLNYTGCVRLSYIISSEFWHKYGKLHREDGPAITHDDGSVSYWLDDRHYTKEGYYKELHKRGIITKEELFIELL